MKIFLLVVIFACLTSLVSCETSQGSGEGISIKNDCPLPKLINYEANCVVTQKDYTYEEMNLIQCKESLQEQAMCVTEAMKKIESDNKDIDELINYSACLERLLLLYGESQN